VLTSAFPTAVLKLNIKLESPIENEGSRDSKGGFQTLINACVCVVFFVWPVAVDITKMISDREGIPRLVPGTL